MNSLAKILFALAWLVIGLGTASAQGLEKRTLVIVDLAGGNDGLNTVIPYADPAYATLRPSLAIPAKSVVALTPQLGLSPSLSALSPAWKAGDLAIVLGVGYPKPNRSHFRSIAIWESASDADTVTETGWLARLVKALPKGPRLADGLIIGETYPGPLSGPWMHNLSLTSLDGFLHDVQDLGILDTTDAAPASGSTGADTCGDSKPMSAAWAVSNVGGDISRWAKALVALKPSLPDLDSAFPRTPFGRQTELAAQLLAAGIEVPVIKLTLRGFDTHTDQMQTQQRLLKDLGDSLAAFRTEMIRTGRWDSTVVMTYSEFGRRVEENGSGGTDHGTASPVLVMGGRVSGGKFVGTEPSLTDLDSGDLKFNTDFRALYATVARGLWGLSDTSMNAVIPGETGSDLPLWKK